MPNPYAIFLCVVFGSFSLSTLARADSPSGNGDPVCGAKCLYIILRAFGEAPESFRKIVNELGPAPKQGYSLKELEDCARKHNLFAESAKLNREELARLCNMNSVIIHLNELGDSKSGHFALCQNVSESGVAIFDSNGFSGEVYIDFVDAWTGNALLVSNAPIDLNAGKPSQQYALGTYLLFAGFIAVGVMIALRIRKSKWIFTKGFLMVIAAIVGCDSAKIRVSEAEPDGIATSAEALQSLETRPPSETGIWVEEDIVNAGDIQRKPGHKLLPIKIYNSDSEPVEIKYSDFSCSCLTCRFSSLTIPVNSSITCELQLETKVLGPKIATVMILTERNQQVSMAVDWNVIASLTSEPGLINGIELVSGESTSSSVRLDQRDDEKLDMSKLQADCVIYTNGAERYLKATAIIEGVTCTVTFVSESKSPSGLVSGQVNVSIPGSVASLGVPFTIYIINDFDLSPMKLFLTNKDGQYFGQLMLSTNDVSKIDPMKLTWKNAKLTPCEFEYLDQGDVRVINILVEPDVVVDPIHLEILAAGASYVREIPVYTPQLVAS